MITVNGIDNGKEFDFGRTSADYSRYRDIYPQEFYQKIADRGLCIKGQKVLDLGTGTGVLPRNMYSYGAEWTGTDISENQISEARRMAEECGMNIDFRAVSTENIDFPDETFDVVTACQCIWYFDQKKLGPQLKRIMKKDGSFLVLYMAWLPFEDKTAGKSEEIILKYNPSWTGCGEKRKPLWISDELQETFDIVYHDEYDIMVPFTRESWHGRMRTCRGVGGSMDAETLKKWDAEHMQMLLESTHEQFNILHYAAIAQLKIK